jgi:urease accessory protein
MERVIRYVAAGAWREEGAADAVTLDFDHRHRRRLRLRSDAGTEFLLDLPQAVALADGDGLCSESGSWIRVNSALEPVLEIRAATAELLMRLAWHVGNRHIPAQIESDRLLIRPDHVIQEMVEGLGGTTRLVEAAFQPESGAYAGRAHGHSHAPHGHGADESRGEAT